MIHIKIDGKPHQIPERWDEVPFETFIKLLDAGDNYVQILSIILKIEEEELRKAKIQGLEIILKALHFLKTPPEMDPQPKELAGKKFPSDITFETVEQFEDVRAEITKVSQLDLKAQTEALAFYAAVYCMDPYDSEKARYLSKSFYLLPCTEVMAAGSFFQAKCLSMQSGLSMNYLRRNIRMKKNRLDFRGFMRRLASTRLWILLRVMWAKMMKKSSGGRSTGSTQN